MLQAKVVITLKRGILDPQGDTVRSALQSLGFDGVADCRVGKFILLRQTERDRAKAAARVEEMCRRLLAHPVNEDFRFDLEEAP
ncbi:MAG: phosphoribosylformylglycinamidine synthase subunit PurS [candidate division NC10 bacterium]|nr:phosphoribosylformylglycinamidine synthase subunit PurS [candidate division NC10 bacterium]